MQNTSTIVQLTCIRLLYIIQWALYQTLGLTGGGVIFSRFEVGVAPVFLDMANVTLNRRQDGSPVSWCGCQVFQSFLKKRGNIWAHCKNRLRVSPVLYPICPLKKLC